MPKAPDLVCFYADIGRPYLPLIRNMVASAKAVMPDRRVILLTTTPTSELQALFDQTAIFDLQTTPKTICIDKARCMQAWQEQMDRPCAFVDPDLEFRHPFEMPDEDVGLLWRQRLAQPVNAGMVFAKPGCPTFWRKYVVTANMLPNALKSWWCDQMAFTVMLGSLHKAGDVIEAYDAKVRLIPERDACTPPEKAHEGTWAIHFKGQRKPGDWSQYFTEPRTETVLGLAG